MSRVKTEAGGGGLRPPRRRRNRKSRGLVWAEYTVFRLVARLFEKARPESLDRWSRRTAAFSRRAVASRTRLAQRNLERAFPGIDPAERDRIVDACWTHYARSVFEYMHAIDEPIESIAERFVLTEEQRARIREIDRDGGIVVTAHFGSWEFAIAVLAMLSREKAVVARPLDNPRIDEHLNRARLRAGVKMLDRRHAARPLIETLARGGVVTMVADQAVKPREGVLVPFLGSPAWTTPAPARLAIRFDVPIHCAFAWPDRASGRFHLQIDPPIVPSALPPEQRTPEVLTRMMNDRMSARIRQTPELWLWMHDRWKGAAAEQGLEPAAGASS